MASAVAHRATADAAEEEWIADTGATVTATTRSALVNPRASNKVLLGFADGDGKVTNVEGEVNMWFHDHKSGDGVGLRMPAVAVDNLRNKILSLPVMVKVLGFRCELSPEDGDFEGLYRLDPNTNQIQHVPLRWDSARRLWFASATTGKTLQAARNAAAAKTKVHRIHFSSEVVATAQQDAAEVISVAQEKATSEDSGDDEPVITLTRRTRERVLTQEQRHRKLMHLGPTGSKTPCHICKQVHGRHSQFYKDGRDAKMPYRNPTPTYSEFPGHTMHICLRGS